jgi:hypothetical protein
MDNQGALTQIGKAPMLTTSFEAAAALVESNESRDRWLEPRCMRMALSGIPARCISHVQESKLPKPGSTVIVACHRRLCSQRAHPTVLPDIQWSTLSRPRK